MLLLLCLIILIFFILCIFLNRKYRISENFKDKQTNIFKDTDNKNSNRITNSYNNPICNICTDCNDILCEACHSLFQCKNLKYKDLKNLKYKDLKKNLYGKTNKTLWDEYYRKKTGLPFAKIDLNNDNSIEKKEWKILKKDTRQYNTNSKFKCNNQLSAKTPFECSNMAIFNVKDNILTERCLKCPSQKCGLCTTSSGLQVCMPYYINSLGKPVQKYDFITCNSLKTNIIAPWLTKPKGWLLGFPEERNYNAQRALDDLTRKTLYKSFKERRKTRAMSKSIRKFDKTHKYTVSQLNKNKTIKTYKPPEDGTMQKRWVTDSRPGPFSKGDLQVPWE
jgi:hypothetical protein